MPKKFATFGGVALDTKEKVVIARAVMKEALKMINPVITYFERNQHSTGLIPVPVLPFTWWNCPAQDQAIDKILHMPIEESTIPNEIDDPHIVGGKWKIESNKYLHFKHPHIMSHYWFPDWEAFSTIKFGITAERIKVFTELSTNPTKTITKEID